MYNIINNITILVGLGIVFLDCLTIENWPLKRIAIIAICAFGIIILVNYILVIITRILYFDKRIPKKEVVPLLLHF